MALRKELKAGEVATIDLPESGWRKTRVCDPGLQFGRLGSAWLDGGCSWKRRELAQAFARRKSAWRCLIWGEKVYWRSLRAEGRPNRS